MQPSWFIDWTANKINGSTQIIEYLVIPPPPPSPCLSHFALLYCKSTSTVSVIYSLHVHHNQPSKFSLYDRNQIIWAISRQSNTSVSEILFLPLYLYLLSRWSCLSKPSLNLCLFAYILAMWSVQVRLINTGHMPEAEKNCCNFLKYEANYFKLDANKIVSTYPPLSFKNSKSFQWAGSYWAVTQLYTVRWRGEYSWTAQNNSCDIR